MEKGKVISAYLEPEQIFRLDQIRGKVSRSKALGKILTYILSQEDSWVAEFIRR